MQLFCPIPGHVFRKLTVQCLIVSLSGDRQQQKQSHKATDHPGITCSIGDVPCYLAALPKSRIRSASADGSFHSFIKGISFCWFKHLCLNNHVSFIVASK